MLIHTPNTISFSEHLYYYCRAEHTTVFTVSGSSSPAAKHSSDDVLTSVTGGVDNPAYISLESITGLFIYLKYMLCNKLRVCMRYF